MLNENIFIVIIAALVVEWLLRAALALLNLAYSGKMRMALPAIITENYEAGAIEKARKYTRAKTIYAISGSLLSLIVLLILLGTGFFGALDRWLQQYDLSALWHGTVYLVSLLIMSAIAQMPLGYIYVFGIEEKFGFNTSGKLLWVRDQVMGIIITLLLSTPVIFSLLYFMQYFPGLWWLLSAGTIILLQILLVLIYPVLIAPLFNKFSYLPEGDLRDGIRQFLQETGYAACEIYTVDGSKRSKHANAYFSGLGKSKRIVLYDTLISLLNVPQLIAVLAHEIGHERKKHIIKSVLLSSFVITLVFYLMSRLYNWPALYGAFSFSEVSGHAALVIFSLLSGPLMIWIDPIIHSLSRRFEYQADRYACEITNDKENLAAALVRLSGNSLSNLNPHPVYSFIYYSHPTLVERVRAIERLSLDRAIE